MKVSIPSFMGTTTAVAMVTAGLLSQHTVNADVVLNSKIMKLTVTSAELSAMAYEEDPPTPEGFEDFGFYDDEPDQALVAEQDGYCFAAFRGTTLTWVDWQQNFQLGNAEVCNTLQGSLFGSKKYCCNTRSGFSDAYNTSYKKALEAAVRKCAKKCKNKDECVVLTGHSQGGAIAAVAGIAMADLNPYVITFGQPATIEPPCPMISSERWYRFVNTKTPVNAGISYDPVPFAPGMGAAFVGHMIVLGEDPSGVAYVGLDSNDSFGPLDVAVNAHSMRAAISEKEAKDNEEEWFAGYVDRLKTLLAYVENTKNEADFPIRAGGFSDYSLCSQSIECLSGNCGKETTFSESRCIGTECAVDDDCPSNRCEHGSCLPKLGSCMACDEDSDCMGGRCLLFRCSSSKSTLMDDNCICKWDTDCDSGRCELFETGECEAQLAVGATCNEDSDCLSNHCNWKFQCDELKPEGARCWSGGDCQSGECSWRFTCSGGAARSSVETASAKMLPENAQSSSSFSKKAVTMLATMGLVAIVAKFVIPAYRRRQDGYESLQATTELTI